jgi:hypothetical protein
LRQREESRSGLDVILVDVYEGTDPRPEVERFRDLWGIKGTILFDESLEYARSLGVRGVPTNILVDSDGTVVGYGLVEPGELYAAVDRLLGCGEPLDVAAEDVLG